MAGEAVRQCHQADRQRTLIVHESARRRRPIEAIREPRARLL